MEVFVVMVYEKQNFVNEGDQNFITGNVFPMIHRIVENTKRKLLINKFSG